MNNRESSEQIPLKEQIGAILNALPDDCTFADLRYELYVLERIRHGIGCADRGELTSHDEVKRRMQKWLEK